MASSSKKRHTFLNVETKLKILERLSKGESGASLAKIYGVGTSTISDIKVKRSQLEQFASKLDSEEGTLKRKTARSANNKALEDAMYIWFTQRRSLGEPISGPLICEKALQFNEQLNGPRDFKASSGWLKNFKSRHGIRELDIQGEKLSSDLAAGRTFIEKFIKDALEKGYSRDDVYNADETGVNWRALPRKSLASRREQSAPGFKVSKERITAMVCANASGEHKIKLLVIGKSKNPRSFKNVHTLPVSYTSQNSAWMSSVIFLEWYKNEFIPSVTKYREEKNKDGKVLLIIDNAPTHPPLEVLNAINGNFEVQFLPPNVTATIQPMDQGVIGKMKKIYRKQLLRHLLLAEKDEESVVQFIKKMNIKDSIYMLADAWDTLTKSNLQRAWNKLWPEEQSAGEEITNVNEDCGVNEVAEICSTIPGFEQCDENDASEWLAVDNNDPGYQILSDQEIVSMVSKEDAETVEPDGKIEDEIEDAGPTHSEAFLAADTLMSWLEKQTESTPTQLILLKRIKDLAAKKRTTTAVQKAITDFF